MNMCFQTIGGFDVAQETDLQRRGKTQTARGRAFWSRLVLLLGLYLDDLLMTAAGICFTSSAALTFGCGAALAVAGACLLAYGVVVARSKGGGGR